MADDRSIVPVACALLEKDGRVLVGQRAAGKLFAGQWEFPGGKIEDGESPESALRREMREEFGVEIDGLRPLPVSRHDYPEFTLDLHPFICRLRDGEPDAREHSEWRWATPEEVETLDLAAADRPVLRMLDGLPEFAEASSAPTRGLASPWFDLAAFITGLSVAGFLEWETKDLVWSLWLSSLLVGYLTLVITLFAPVFSRDNPLPAAAGFGRPLTALGALFGLAFFTVHFGGFHLVHSIFLYGFFPLLDDAGGTPAWPVGQVVYLEVVHRYWPWVAAAVLAERLNLVKAVRAKNLAAPYINVVRMHLLLFFFAVAHFGGLDAFVVFAIVYAVYFFPWRFLAAWRPKT